MVWFYHRVRFIYPYCIFSLTVSIGLFFSVILFFIKKKMNLVAELKDEILRMASGNLRDSVPNMGQDFRQRWNILMSKDGLRGIKG